MCTNPRKVKRDVASFAPLSVGLLKKVRLIIVTPNKYDILDNSRHRRIQIFLPVVSLYQLIYSTFSLLEYVQNNLQLLR